MRVPRAAVLLTAGILSTGLLGLTGAGTLSSLTARITTDPNSLALGSLVLKLTSDGATCTSTDGPAGSDNTATCTTIQPLTGRADLLPGQTYTKIVTAQNTGTTDPRTFVLTPGACSATGTIGGNTTQAAKDDICNRVSVTIDTGSGQSSPVTAAALNGTTYTLPAPAHGTATTVTVRTTIDNVGNAYQGLGVTVPMTWTLQQ